MSFFLLSSSVKIRLRHFPLLWVGPLTCSFSSSAVIMSRNMLAFGSLTSWTWMLKSPRVTKLVLLAIISTKHSVKMSRNWGILPSGSLYTPIMLRKEFIDVTFHLAYSISPVILASTIFTLRLGMVTQCQSSSLFISLMTFINSVIRPVMFQSLNPDCISIS